MFAGLLFAGLVMLGFPLLPFAPIWLTRAGAGGAALGQRSARSRSVTGVALNRSCRKRCIACRAVRAIAVRKSC